jgi:hypothetical protein
MKIEGEKAGLYQCFATNCGSKGNIISLIMEMENCGYKEALASILTEEETVHVDKNELEHLTKQLLSIGIDLNPHNLVYPIPQDCSKYYVKDFFLESKEKGGRGYSEDEFNQLITDNVMYCQTGFYRNKIILPVYNENGEQIAFVARTLDKSILEKYRYPKGWKKNLFVCKLEAESDEPPMICEGYFDGLHIQGIWKRTALIIFGSSITTAQVAWIAKRHNRISFALDGDEAGEIGIYKAIPKFQQYGVETNVLSLPDGYDPPLVSKEILASLQIIEAKDFTKQWESDHMLRTYCPNINQK